jgi:hypothetical protein
MFTYLNMGFFFETQRVLKSAIAASAGLFGMPTIVSPAAVAASSTGLAIADDNNPDKITHSPNIVTI